MVECFRLEMSLKLINQECIFLPVQRYGFRAGRGRGKDVVVTVSSWSKQDATAEVYNTERGYKEVKASFAFHILSQQKIKEMISWNAIWTSEPMNILLENE